MLLVAARAGRSKIEGIGLIAQEFIPAGTRVWVFREGFDLAVLPEEIQDLSPPAQEQLLHYGWLDAGWGRVLVSADDDRFTNHSVDPNTHWSDGHTVAVRDIEPGEEITFDYRALGGCNLFGWGDCFRKRRRSRRQALR